MNFSQALSAAIRRRLDRWVFRRGILTPFAQQRVTLAGHWTGQVDRILGPGQEHRIDRRGMVWKRSASGLIVPLWERFAWQNLVVTAGLNYSADASLSGGTPITTWYLMLMSATPTPAAGDTMSSHAGWTEFTGYSESVRQTWTDGGVSSGVVTNSASAAVFTSNANSQSVGGAALTSVSTKSGTTGTLFAAGAFSGGNKALDDTETLTVTAQFTFADDGA